MNNFIKQVIEEKFASKAQQRFFYAKANEKGKPKKEKKKWGKWAKEFSDDTDYSKIPDKVEKEEEVDEIVDKNGNIARNKKQTDLPAKGITQKKTTDIVAKTGAGQMGSYGLTGVNTYRRYWGEGEEITKEKILEIALNKALGADDTILKDVPYDDAKSHMEDELGLSDDDAEDRLEKMGYDENLPDDKVRLVENPKKFMGDYIEHVLKGKTKDNDIVDGDVEEEVNPIVKKQLKSLKNSMDSHKLSMDTIVKYLKDNE
jgi:hypothetical protein